MKVRVVHGANETGLDVAGNSVSVVRRQLRDQFNIPDDAIAIVNGTTVDDGYILGEDDNLEFIRSM